MRADLAVRLAAGADAVLLASEVAEVFVLSDLDASKLMLRTRPLRGTSARGQLRYRYGDLLRADTEAPAIGSSTPPAPAPFRAIAEVTPRQPGLPRRRAATG